MLRVQHQGRAMRVRCGWHLVFVAVAILSGCSLDESPQGSDATTQAAQIALGEKVFADLRLSADGHVSCASCHRPALAFTDGRPVSLGIGGRAGTRNAPSLLTAPSMSHLFWDGREDRLEVAVTRPFTNPVEMGLRSPTNVIDRLKGDSKYRVLFDRAFPDDGHAITMDRLGLALATYLRSLPSPNSAFDRYRAGQGAALSPEQIAGLGLFAGKSQCGNCHHVDRQAALLSDQDFHHAGVGDAVFAGKVADLMTRLQTPGDSLGALVLSEADIAGLGRFVVTRKPTDLAAFRTPSLRNVAVTAPYMHDGSIGTLSEAVDHELYYRGLSLGRPISLTMEERGQLTAFLHSLTDARYAESIDP